MKKPSLTIVFTVAALTAIPLATIYNSRAAATGEAIPVHQTASAQNSPDVGVWEVQRGTYQASITGFGEAASRYQLTLTAEVSGRVTALADNFSTGQQVAGGDLLATLDNSTYEEALAAARSDLAQAEVTLLEEQRQAEQALTEWEQSGLQGSPDSPLVLREPYVNAAKASVEQAREQVRAARHDLENTRIRSPFNALVVTRDVQPGSYVTAGTQIATLFSTDRMEITIPLAASQWNNLPASESLQEAAWQVTLTAQETGVQWFARVERVARHVDSSSRQRSVTVTLENPLQQDPPLYPGTFVEARIQGKSEPDLWKIPASAVSQNNSLWLVNDQNLLEEIPARVSFQEAGFSYVVPPAGLPRANIVIRPLSTYLVGMHVNPVKEGES